MKSFARFLRFAAVGWLAGTLFAVAMGLIWPAIFPGLVRSDHYYEGPPISLVTIIVATLLLTSLPALIGGLVGGSISREGGQREQLITAAIGGIILSAPFGCFNFWMMSGA